MCQVRELLNMHYCKMKAESVRNILEHIERGIERKDTHEHSNESIDKSRTHLNYDLVQRNESVYKTYKDILTGLNQEKIARSGKKIRKDAVTLCSWVVTLPEGIEKEKERAFFEISYKYFCDRYGKEKIIAATVHNDEITPHMHLELIPIINEKDGHRRLCAKDLETRLSLKQVHPELQQILANKLNCEVKLLNGATDGGNLTVKELKAKTLEERADTALKKLVAVQKTALEYEPPAKKLFESQTAYEERTLNHQQAVAVKLRQKQLDFREGELNRREERILSRENAFSKLEKDNSYLSYKLAESEDLLEQTVHDYDILRESVAHLERENKRLKTLLEDTYSKLTGEYESADELLNQRYAQRTHRADFGFEL